MHKRTFFSIVDRALLWLLVVGMMVGLAGCNRLEAGIEPRVTAIAAVTVTPEPTGAPTDSLPTPAHTPTPVLDNVPSGLVYFVYNEQRTVAIWEAETANTYELLSMPSDAGRVVFSKTGNVAYVLENVLYLGNLATRQTREAYVRGGIGADWDLCWSNDGSTLAYAVAWDEADGSRVVELGFTDGYEQRVVATVQARAAGPTPTPPSEPMSEPEPGFANLAILGFDRVAGHLVVMPVGGAESKRVIWTYDVRTGERVAEVEWPTEYVSWLSPVPVLSADLSHLATYVPDTETQPAALVVVPRERPNEPVARAELPAGTHATWLTWSPDGQQLAYSLNEGSEPGLDVSPSLGIWVWQWTSGQPNKLPSPISPELLLHGWTADGQAVVLGALDGISRQQSYTLVRVSDGKVQPLFIPENGIVMEWFGPAPAENWTDAEPTPTQVVGEGESVEGWKGTITKLEPGNQFGRYFQREDGERFDISGTNDAVNERIAEAQRTGATLQVWGRVFYGVPADQARHIEAERAEIVSGPATEARNLAPLAQPSASSVLPAGAGGPHAAPMSIDGQVETAWVEAADGPGQGEWLMLSFPTPVTVSKLGIDVGYDLTAATFAANNRLKKATLIFSNGQQIPLEFADERGVQVREIEPVETTYVQIVINEVYPGSTYDDTCLAEVEVWGTAQ